MIDIENLRVERGGKSICRVDSLTVAAGERLAVVGPNGSGKTTLLKVTAGLVDDYSGTCRVALGRRDRVYVHQQPYMFRGTVAENVAYGVRRGGRRDGANGRAEVERYMKSCKLERLADRRAKVLSGGEARRVALARALACGPRLLLADEPLSELDDEMAEAVCQVLKDLQGVTLVIASPVELPAGLATRTFRLGAG